MRQLLGDGAALVWVVLYCSAEAEPVHEELVRDADRRWKTSTVICTTNWQWTAISFEIGEPGIVSGRDDGEFGDLGGWSWMVLMKVLFRRTMTCCVSSLQDGCR